MGNHGVVDPDKMTSKERFERLAEILAHGLVRLVKEDLAARKAARASEEALDSMIATDIRSPEEVADDDNDD